MILATASPLDNITYDDLYARWERGNWRASEIDFSVDREQWQSQFSDLERAIPGISQKMLTQQLRQLEGDGIVTRTVHAEVPPKVEYHLTEWGQSLCPALDKLLTWAEQQPAPTDADRPRFGPS